MAFIKECPHIRGGCCVVGDALYTVLCMKVGYRRLAN